MEWLRGGLQKRLRQRFVNNRQGEGRCVNGRGTATADPAGNSERICLGGRDFFTQLESGRTGTDNAALRAAFYDNRD